MQRVEGYEQFKNRHKGEVGLVIANGLGLNRVPLDFLAKYPSFGVNRIHLLYDKTGFTPTYYVCNGFNQFDTEEKRAMVYPMLEYVEAAFLNRYWIHEFPFDNVHGILSTKPYTGKASMEFSYDPLHTYGIGWTVTYVALQIAFYMGFDPVLIVGLDHRYPTGPFKHFYEDGEASLWEIGAGPHDPAEWQRGCDRVFAKANHAYRMAGRRIINLSNPTACTVFERGDIGEWR